MIEALSIALPKAQIHPTIENKRYEVTIRQSASGGWNIEFVPLPATIGGALTLWVADDRTIRNISLP
jgi:hypothetical protein